MEKDYNLNNDSTEKIPVKNPPSILLLSGLDPTGGAGISADIRTATEWKVYPLPIITALTAQNHKGVHKIEAPSTETIVLQLNDVIDAIRPDAVKIGMLPNAAIVKAIAEVLKNRKLKNIVLDPVLSATTGGALTGGNQTMLAMADSLFPLVRLITPNQLELQLFDQLLKSYNRPGMLDSCKATLITGGDTKDNYCVDRLYKKSRINNEFYSLRIESRNLHGTGCVYSTSIACNLAQGTTLYKAVDNSKCLISDIIENSAPYSIIPGYGPVLV